MNEAPFTSNSEDAGTDNLVQEGIKKSCSASASSFHIHKAILLHSLELVFTLTSQNAFSIPPSNPRYLRDRPRRRTKRAWSSHRKRRRSQKRQFRLVLRPDSLRQLRPAERHLQEVQEQDVRHSISPIHMNFSY